LPSPQSRKQRPKFQLRLVELRVRVGPFDNAGASVKGGLVASEQGRTIVPEREPEKGYYYRSDQFSFAKKGVPALYTSSVTVEDNQDYTANRYHKPSDEYDPNWNMEGAVLDGEALFHVGLRVANVPQRPEWRPGNEFRAVREEMLGKK